MLGKFFRIVEDLIPGRAERVVSDGRRIVRKVIAAIDDVAALAPTIDLDGKSAPPARKVLAALIYHHVAALALRASALTAGASYVILRLRSVAFGADQDDWGFNHLSARLPNPDAAALQELTEHDLSVAATALARDRALT